MPARLCLQGAVTGLRIAGMFSPIYAQYMPVLNSLFRTSMGEEMRASVFGTEHSSDTESEDEEVKDEVITNVDEANTSHFGHS